MAEAEQPERLRGDREVTVDDVRQLVASATPHFALPDPQPDPEADHAACRPTRRCGSTARRRSRKLEPLGFTGEVRGTPEQPGMRELPSVSEHEQPRYIPGATAARRR